MLRGDGCYNVSIAGGSSTHGVRLAVLCVNSSFRDNVLL